MCYQSHSGKQFEFIQNNWANHEHIASRNIGQDGVIGHNSPLPPGLAFQQETPDLQPRKVPVRWGQDVDPANPTNSFGGLIKNKDGEYIFTLSISFLHLLLVSQPSELIVLSGLPRKTNESDDQRNDRAMPKPIRYEAGNRPFAHMFFFQLSDTSRELVEDFMDLCAQYSAGHPGQRHFSVGIRALEINRDVSGTNFEVSVHMIFNSIDEFNKYSTSDPPGIHHPVGGNEPGQDRLRFLFDAGGSGRGTGSKGNGQSERDNGKRQDAPDVKVTTGRRKKVNPIPT